MMKQSDVKTALNHSSIEEEVNLKEDFLKRGPGGENLVRLLNK